MDKQHVGSQKGIAIDIDIRGGGLRPAQSSALGVNVGPHGINSQRSGSQRGVAKRISGSTGNNEAS